MPEQTGKKTKGKKSDPRRKGRDGRKNSPEKKEKRKSVNETVLGQLGKSDFMGAELTRAAGGSLFQEAAGLRVPAPDPSCTYTVELHSRLWEPLPSLPCGHQPELPRSYKRGHIGDMVPGGAGGVKSLPPRPRACARIGRTCYKTCDALLKSDFAFR